MAKNPIAGCSIGNWNRIVRSNAEGVVSKSNNVICWEQWTVGLSGRGVYMKKYNNKYEIQFFRDLQMLIIKIFFPLYILCTPQSKTEGGVVAAITQRMKLFVTSVDVHHNNLESLF